ncbi:MAG: hypothetical protein Q8Q10_02500 [bacterium]|nr:hypothetical protein [bacterium]
MEQYPKGNKEEFSMTEPPEKYLTGVSIERPGARIRQELHESQFAIMERLLKLFEEYYEVLDVIDMLSETNTSGTAPKERLDDIFMRAKGELAFVVEYRRRLQEPLPISGKTVRLLDEQFAEQGRKAQWLMIEIKQLLEEPTPINQELSADERASKKTGDQEDSRARSAA